MVRLDLFPEVSGKSARGQRGAILDSRPCECDRLAALQAWQLHDQRGGAVRVFGVARIVRCQGRHLHGVGHHGERRRLRICGQRTAAVKAQPVLRRAAAQRRVEPDRRLEIKERERQRTSRAVQAGRRVGRKGDILDRARTGDGVHHLAKNGL